MINKDIFNLYEALEEMAQDKEIKFNIQLSYNFAYNKKVLEPCYRAIMEVRDNLLEKYGKRTAEGWRVPSENVPEFQKEWQEFMNIDTSVELREVKLQDIPNTQINVDLISRLFPIIKE